MTIIKHTLVKLTTLIDWFIFEPRRVKFCSHHTGRAASLPQLIADLLELEHTFACSDEYLSLLWVVNPYWQLFSVET
jgi:IS5 family transposase